MAKILTSSSSKFTPILKSLSAVGHSILTIHQHFAQTLTNLDINAAPLIGSVTGETRQAAMTEAAKTNAILSRFKCRQNGILPAVKETLENDLAGLIYGDLPEIILFVLALDEARPDLILLHNDVEQIHRAAAFWGNAHQIPSLHIPHAIYQDIENRHDIHRVVTATYLASAGPYQTKWYAECGMAEQSIFETGLPQFDEYATLHLDKQRAKQALGLSLDKPVIMYASSWSQNTNIMGMHDGVSETYEAILECAKQMPDVQFLIKTHPHGGNDAQQHLDRARQAKAPVTVTPHHLPHCLQASDLLLAYGPSNILLEGAHIPWLRLACTSGYRNDPEIHKILTDPPNIPWMVQAMYEILSRPILDMGRLRAKYLGPCDGQNHKRILELINHLLPIEEAIEDDTA